jgi:hypothetical protein
VRQALPNRRDAAHIMLPKPATAWVKLKIVEVYAGGRHTDTCLTYIAPDFEYEDRRGRRR